jgi:PAS domain S-box-containing protein
VDRNVPLDLALRLRDSGGRESWVRIRGKSTRDENGRALRTSGSLSDITDAKAAERVLRENEARFRSLYEQTSEPYLILDGSGIRDCNSAALRLFGYTDKEQLLGTSPYGSLLAPEFQPDGSASVDLGNTHVSEAYQTGHAVFEWQHRRADGTEFPAEVRLSPMPALGDQAVFAVIRDLTKQKRAEADLRSARQEAESANRAKSAFLANMSHELRTPMNAIIGYSEMLIEDLEDSDQQEWREDLEKIHSAGRHLLSLINDILDLSKVEAGRMDLYLERFDLAPVVHQAADTVEPLVAKTGNTLERRIPDDLGAVRMDLTKVRQCLLNLLSNALKFTENGVVTVTVRREPVPGASDTEQVLFEVRDSGIGIPEDKLDTIFDEFRQADDSTTRRFGGTGLGLAISRRFCRMMGGDLTVSSTVGQGSLFTMRIPARVDALEAARGAAPAGPAGESLAASSPQGKAVVLVIEDEPHAGELLARTLERGGFHPVVAATGEEGLELARRVRPAVITLDVMMKGLDGWAVLESLKKDPDLADTPVVMVTMLEDRDLGYALGAAEYLTKPVDRDQLIEVIERLAADSSGPILVVDDDPEARSMIRRQLDGTGRAVMEAGDGSEALTRARERRPAAVILDLMMPVMDGFEFIRDFRADPAFESTPIVVVTAKTLDAAEREALRSQVATVLQKGDYTRDNLLEQVRKALRPPGEAEVA